MLETEWKAVATRIAINSVVMFKKSKSRMLKWAALIIGLLIISAFIGYFFSSGIHYCFLLLWHGAEIDHDTICAIELYCHENRYKLLHKDDSLKYRYYPLRYLLHNIYMKTSNLNKGKIALIFAHIGNRRDFLMLHKAVLSPDSDMDWYAKKNAIHVLHCPRACSHRQLYPRILDDIYEQADVTTKFALCFLHYNMKSMYYKGYRQYVPVILSWLDDDNEEVVRATVYAGIYAEWPEMIPYLEDKSKLSPLAQLQVRRIIRKYPESFNGKYNESFGVLRIIDEKDWPANQ